MIKSEFDSYVSKALDNILTDYHTFTKIMLFCDYLWREIEGNTNDKRTSTRNSEKIIL